MLLLPGRKGSEQYLTLIPLRYLGTAVTLFCHQANSVQFELFRVLLSRLHRTPRFQGLSLNRVSGSIRPYQFLAVVEEAPVMERILPHTGVWYPSTPLRAPRVEEEWPDNSRIPLTYYPVPDIA